MLDNAPLALNMFQTLYHPWAEASHGCCGGSWALPAVCSQCSLAGTRDCVEKGETNLKQRMDEKRDRDKTTSVLSSV